MELQKAEKSGRFFRGRFEAVVPSQRKRKENVFFTRAGTDIVNDQRNAGLAFLVADQHDVRQIAGQGAGNHISGLVVLRVVTGSEMQGVSGEPDLQIWHPPVVDVAVGFFQPPAPWVERKIAAHVLMDFLLQVKPMGLSECPDYHICTYAAVGGNVASRVLQFDVGRIIMKSYPDLVAGFVYERAGAAGSLCADAAGQGAEDDQH